MTGHLRAPEALPRLMGAADAARYLGISEKTLLGLGLPRLKLGARRLYDRHQLDDFASALPTDGQDSEEEVNSCDAILRAAAP